MPVLYCVAVDAGEEEGEADPKGKGKGKMVKREGEGEAAWRAAKGSMLALVHVLVELCYAKQLQTSGQVCGHSRERKERRVKVRKEG